MNKDTYNEFIKNVKITDGCWEWMGRKWKTVSPKRGEVGNFKNKLAKEYRVSFGTIDGIVNGISWKHLLTESA